MATYVNFNGQLISTEAKILEVSNRSFRYGDGLFESMFATKKQVPLVDKHYKRLTQGLEALSFELPSSFTLDFFEENIARLLTFNKHFKGANVRFHAFRNGNGNYFPANNSFSFIIESEAVERENFQLNAGKIILDIFTEIPKPMNILSSYKTANSLLFIQAALWAKSYNLKDCLIVNTEGSICEATYSNVFVVVDRHLTTPALTSGCVRGVMRQAIIDVARNNVYQVEEVTKLEPQLLLRADEVFLTNAVSGIRWVSGFKKRRYYSKQAAALTELLNSTLGI